MFLILSPICLILLIVITLKLWKQSPLLAVLGFFFWPVLVYAMIKFWGDEESDIKVPVLILLVLSLYAFYDMRQYAAPTEEEHSFRLPPARMLT